MSKYIYIKTRHLFISKLYFGFFQTQLSLWRFGRNRSETFKCLVSCFIYIHIYIYVYIYIYIYIHIYILYIYYIYIYIYIYILYIYYIYTIYTIFIHIYVHTYIYIYNIYIYICIWYSTLKEGLFEVAIENWPRRFAQTL